MKNPWMSLWLSGANTMLGHARGRAAAETKRQTTHMMNETTRQVMQFWTGGWAVPPAAKKRSRKRK